ncbi:MAG: short-chain dehydrogenase [Glaciihabitans sp.]|nr:short-chain dehydrogenase [Glaciihabitans sp.]
MTCALVTGASSGLGAEFARQLAAAGHDLVLVARNEERLSTLAAQLRSRFGISVEVIVADLADAEQFATVERRVATSTSPVDVLVNNAGLGLRRPFEATDVAEESMLLEVMVAVPMKLTHAALGQMLPRRSGTVINVASVAGFVPRGSYGAAKAWILSFSRSANVAYRRRGVTVTAVAPGFVRTDFHRTMKVRTDTVPDFLWLDAASVVRLALADVARGRAVSIPTVRYKALVAVAKLLPDRITARGELLDL